MNNLANKLLHIKLLVLDVDGVLTDGRVYYTPEGSEIKGFHVHDGLGIRSLIKHGIRVAIISGRASKATQARMDDLGVKLVFLGITDKNLPYQELKNSLKLTDDNIAYIGDDLPDIAVMSQVGFAVAVANASKEVIAIADYTTKADGGSGAVREICDLILNNQPLKKS